MNKRPRLLTREAFFDNFALAPAALFKRQGDGSLHGVDYAERRNHVAANFSGLLSAGVENRCIRFRRAQFFGFVTGSAMRSAGLGDMPCKSDGARPQITFDDLVKEPQSDGFRRPDRLA